MHATYDNPIKILLESFRGKKKLDILDYGCGDASVLEYIPRNIVNSYTGFDVNTNSLKAAHKKFIANKFKFVKIENGKLPNLGKKNSFDVVIAIGSLQYMSSVEINSLLKESKRVLRRNGIIIISCASDHLLYRFTDVYRLAIPHGYISRKNILKIMKTKGFKIEECYERGLIFSPLFLNACVIPFDISDKLFFRTKGSLGPFGKASRKVAALFVRLEYLIPIDFGYTLYIKSIKK
ncbi:MAG TPA: class I SAM-dependent methyltransferase [Patescibacteria group bacterium]|nr:class I SAM-dependent methyltransferase [Patescibacteria group bacterium]